MNLEIFPHSYFMQQAYQQAQAAFAIDEVPVGAVVVRDQQIIGAAHNLSRQLRDPTAHAEMIAITQAAESVGDWRLEGCTLYVTLEPCIMCSGAILQARIPQVVFGASEPKGGGVESMYQLLSDGRLNHRCEVVKGVLDTKCSQVLTEFFSRKRALGKK
jgi:tRNA(adenine34) deaminase